MVDALAPSRGAISRYTSHLPSRDRRGGSQPLLATTSDVSRHPSTPESISRILNALSRLPITASGDLSDRNSVVWGKSVPLRADTVGRRIIKENKEVK